MSTQHLKRQPNFGVPGQRYRHPYMAGDTFYDRLVSAHRDLDEANTIAKRGPMPLHLADIELHRARLFHDPAALARAATLIHQHAYHRRLPELDHARATLT